ncbi:MAG TPA: RNA polymerase sigma factor [Spirochaetota bacterium]|nr:RNA polymerase sigma factor [Spirochaetota bacterium]HRX49464.1 RNA polymerase sigma factor [Spirochaetota bacterium]
MIPRTEIETAYDLYSKEIFTYILRSVHDQDEAEDILQDVFIKLINYSVKSSVHSGNIRALLYSIARSVCIDSARKRSRAKIDTTDITMLPDRNRDNDMDSSDEIIDIINSIIDTLGEPEKSIILFRKNGLTYSEIAPIMKISERTLKRKVKSVIEYIRKKLRDKGFFIPDDTDKEDESFN